MKEQVYVWGNARRLNTYSNYFKREFGERVQKVSIDAGFTCPNRDGTLATGGCTYCNNRAFNPSYCTPEKTVTQQILEGIAFHKKRYRRANKYLAYFQAYSNTYDSLEKLQELYNEALSVPGMAGLVIGTRPDCVDEEKLDYFSELAKKTFLTIEYGIESCYNKTLEKILQNIIKEHKRVIFNGDNYIEDWMKEAKKRDLPNLRSTPEALKILLSTKAGKLLNKYKVLNKRELHSRYEVFTEQYDMTVMIEGKLALDMAKTMILPVALKHQELLADNLVKLDSLGIKVGIKEQKVELEKVSGMIVDLCKANTALEKATANEDSAKIVSAMNVVREAVDTLELEVDDALWPLPKYGEMLFVY